MSARSKMRPSRRGSPGRRGFRSPWLRHGQNRLSSVRRQRGRREQKQPELPTSRAILGDLIVRPVRQQRGPCFVALLAHEQPHRCDEAVAAPSDGNPLGSFQIRRPRRVAIPAPVRADQQQPVLDRDVLHRRRAGKTRFATRRRDPHVRQPGEVQNAEPPTRREPQQRLDILRDRPPIQDEPAVGRRIASHPLKRIHTKTVFPGRRGPGVEAMKSP